MSLTSSTFPNSWKKANVIPIHKKGDCDDSNNYRPISILPVISKITERIVFKYVYNYLHVNKLICKDQSGFQPNESTVNQLAFMYHEFCKALDQKKDVRIVFGDVSRAFDKVWHNGIIFKLKQNGIKGSLLQWFENYLSDRKQRVVIRGQASEWGDVSAGVPQGSVLGPLLFIVYINDLANVVDCKIKMFADDTCLYIDIDEPDKVENSLSGAKTMNRNLESVKEWSNQWLVTFNASKTKSMIISNRDVPHPDITFNGVKLENVSSHKHLGLIINKRLNWTEHVDAMLKSASCMLDVSRSLMYKLDRETLEIIYHSFIRPKLEYASQIWDDCNDREIQKLENFQLSAARLVTGAKKGTSHELLYDETKWQTLCNRRKDVKLVHMHKIVHKKVPSYLSDLLPEPKTVNTRGIKDIRNMLCRTTKLSKSFFPDCIDRWNNLDIEVRNISDLDQFKNAVIAPKKYNKLFNYGVRKWNIIHAQMRLSCSNLKAHLKSLHVTDDASCICGHNLEDVEHFFFYCTLYNVQRHSLFNSLQKLPINNVNVDILLNGDPNVDIVINFQIFDAVHKFIESSERFN